MTSEAIKEYWERSVYLLLLDVTFTDMKPHFSQEIRLHDKNTIN